ncbi:MAG: HAD-IA family hydrolase [Alphaproteobacteria bacterium]|nr:HAD-IA family hydrolase [Alphaproteobacteria bacterium]
MIGTLLLDLDGTLVDSVPDLAASLNRLMAARRLARFSEAETAAMVGDGARKLVERAFAARGHSADEAAIDAFLSDYGAHLAAATRPYPGVETTLRAMTEAGWQLAVCTNKPEAMARELLAKLGLADLFRAIGGGDSFGTRKPDPAHLLATLRAAGGTPHRAVMAGDHANDVMAAAGAGLPCIFADWGYGPPEMARGAAAVAERFADLPPVAARLLSP